MCRFQYSDLFKPNFCTFYNIFHTRKKINSKFRWHYISVLSIVLAKQYLDKVSQNSPRRFDAIFHHAVFVLSEESLLLTVPRQYTSVEVHCSL